MTGDPWLARFQQHLLRQDLAENTIRGYLADLRYFGQWLAEWHGQPVDLARVTEADIRAYRQHLVNTRRQKPATVNRRLQSGHRPAACRAAPEGYPGVLFLPAAGPFQGRHKRAN